MEGVFVNASIMAISGTLSGLFVHWDIPLNLQQGVILIMRVPISLFGSERLEESFTPISVDKNNLQECCAGGMQVVAKGLLRD